MTQGQREQSHSELALGEMVINLVAGFSRLGRFAISFSWWGRPN